MDYESEVVDFLSQPDNIEHVIEISERIDQVKKKIMADFWISMFSKMKDQLEAHFPNWEVKPSDQDYDSNYAGYNLNWKIAPFEKFTLGFSCQQEHRGYGKYQLFVCICWSQQFPANPEIDTSSIAALQNYCQKKGYLISGQEWAVGWTWLDYYTVDKNFIIKFVKDRESYVSDIHECVWSIFSEVRELIQKANEELDQGLQRNDPKVIKAVELIEGK
jgi:hypothetical protein